MENLAFYLPNLERFWFFEQRDLTHFSQKFGISFKDNLHKVSGKLFYLSGSWSYNLDSSENLGSCLYCNDCNYLLANNINLLRFPSCPLKDSINLWASHQSFSFLDDSSQPIPKENCGFIDCDTLFVNKRTIMHDTCPGCKSKISLKSSPEFNQIYLSKIYTDLLTFSAENILAHKLLSAREFSNKIFYKFTSNAAVNFSFFVKILSWDVIVFEENCAFQSILCNIVDSCDNFEIIDLYENDISNAFNFLKRNFTPLGNYVRVKCIKNTS
jgi:hypothetical protein